VDTFIPRWLAYGDGRLQEVLHVPFSLVYIAEEGRLIPQWQKESAFYLTTEIAQHSDPTISGSQACPRYVAYGFHIPDFLSDLEVRH
jgi:hypothetical protein